MQPGTGHHYVKETVRTTKKELGICRKIAQLDRCLVHLRAEPTTRLT